MHTGHTQKSDYGLPSISDKLVKDEAESKDERNCNGNNAGGEPHINIVFIQNCQSGTEQTEKDTHFYNIDVCSLVRFDDAYDHQADEDENAVDELEESKWI